jgi:hypothetical protein
MAVRLSLFESQRKLNGDLTPPHSKFSRPHTNLVERHFCRAALANDDLPRQPSTIPVDVIYRSRPQPSIAPIIQRDDDSLEASPFLSEEIFARRAGLRPHLHQSIGEECLQSLGQNIWSNAKASLEIREAGVPTEKSVAQDEQAPALSNKLESARSRANLPWIISAQHFS